MILTEEETKILYKLYEEDMLVANIILELKDDRIYTSIIMFKEVEIDDLSRILKAARADFMQVLGITRRKREIEITKLLEENVVKV